jgi:hypothetical protein
MGKVTFVYIFLLLYSLSLANIEEVEHYNIEIKNNISSNYSGSFDKKGSSRSSHQKWLAEDFFMAAEDFFQEKEAQYKEYKRNLEKTLEKNLNSRIVPAYLDSNLEVIVRIDVNTENLKLKYRYTPDLIKESHIDLGFEKEELRLSYIYEKPVDGLGGYFFNSVGYLFDKSVKNILEISRMKVR